MKVAIYCRLSREDDDKLHENDESESIQNQKSMLINYAIKRSWDIYNIYCDEDYSGIDSKRHANLKYKYGNRSFWCTGYYVSTVGNNKTAVQRYVQNQLKEDMMTDQITIKEYKDPFKGSK